MKGIPHHDSSSLYIPYSLLSSPECKSQSIVHIYHYSKDSYISEILLYCYRLWRRNIRTPLGFSKIIDHTMPCLAAKRKDSCLEVLG